MKTCVVTLVSVASILGGAGQGTSVLAQDLIGDQFQVNSYTTGYQAFTGVTSLGEGNFVVMWTTEGSYGTDQDEGSISGRVFDGQGDPVGAEFQVNTYTTGHQTWGGAASASDGSSVLTWQSFGSPGPDTTGASVQARRFSPEGLPLNGQFQVNTTTTESGALPTIAMSEGGQFVITWLGLDAENDGIRGQLFDAGGARVGGEFVANEETDGRQYQQSVSMSGGGEFLVVWYSQGVGIKARFFASDGAPSGSEFRVDDEEAQTANWPGTAAGDAGHFLVVWASLVSSPQVVYSVRGRLYTAPGEPLGPSFEVGGQQPGAVYGLSAEPGSRGEYLVVWSAYEAGKGTEVHAREVTSLGSVLGTEFVVNTYSTGVQGFPVAARTIDGEFIVVWHGDGSFGTDTDEWSIQGQRAATATLFSDGFESGDSSGWSSVVPQE